MKNFASDNNGGVWPEVLAYLPTINVGHVHAYGGDAITERAKEVFASQFGPQTQTFFVFNGTAANVAGLAHITGFQESIACAMSSHLQQDECGAPEALAGLKLLPLESADGKLHPEMLDTLWIRRGDQHCRQLGAISITQPTEYGTVYSLAELKALTDWAHRRQVRVHMDGARLVNAAVALGCSLKTMTTDVGVDLLSFGGTKNGLLGAEAVVFLNPTLATHFNYRRKQMGQLASKMRFIAGQFLVFFENDRWRHHAEHVCRMAKLLESELEHIPAVRVTQKVQSNAVFAVIPQKWLHPLREKYFFYVWNEKTTEVRWMTNFDTNEEDVKDFVGMMKRLS